MRGIWRVCKRLGSGRGWTRGDWIERIRGMRFWVYDEEMAERLWKLSKELVLKV